MAASMPRTPPKADSTAMNFYLPSKLHGKVKAAAALRGVSMQDLVIDLLTNQIDQVLEGEINPKGKPRGK